MQLYQKSFQTLSPWGKITGIYSEYGLSSLTFQEDKEWVTTRIERYYPESCLIRLRSEPRGGDLVDGLDELSEGHTLSSFIKTTISQTENWVNNYFTKKKDCLSSLPPLDLQGSELTINTLKALLEVPWGQTKSYGDIAKSVGNEKAVRAIGGIVGRNPFSIMVPCHRIIGSQGQLTGFRGGLEQKKWLLKHEGLRVSESHVFKPESDTH